MTVQAAAPVLENPREDYQDILHRVFSNILAHQNFPLQARLFSVAGFAFEADAFVYPESPDFSEERLAHEVDKAVEQVHERLWMEQFHNQSVNPELGMSIIQSLLLGRVQHCAPEFKELIMQAWRQYSPEESQTGGRFLHLDFAGEVTHVRCTEMSRIYQYGRNRLMNRFAEEIEAEIADFCIRMVAKHDNREPGVTLLSSVQQLILRVMCLKFFLAADPELQAFLDCEASDNMVRRRISEITEQVETHLDQEQDVLAKLGSMLYEQGLQDLPHTILLILF